MKSPDSNLIKRETFFQLISAFLSFIFIIVFFSLLFKSVINIYSFSGLLLTLICLLLSLIILSNGQSKRHLIWSLFNFSTASWGAINFVIAQQHNYSHALFFWKILIITMVFVSVTFYHTIHNFSEKNNNFVLKVFYIQGLLFIFFDLFTTGIVKSLDYRFNQFYYLNSSYGFDLFFLVWISIIIYSFKVLIKYYKQTTGLKRIQTKYLLFATLIGWCGSSTAAFLVYDIKVYPLGNYFICIYAAISTYAIFRYRLMDIKIAVTRLGILILVYTLVLGIPIALEMGGKSWFTYILGDNWFWGPMLILLVLSTIGPYVYFYFQKIAEDRILQEQRRYQATLRQASTGMGKIKDLKKLLNMIVYVLTHAIQIEHALIYIYDESQSKYILGAFKKKSGQSHFIEEIIKDSPLVEYFLKNKNPLIFEEINQRATDSNDSQLTQIKKIIASL